MRWAGRWAIGACALLAWAGMTPWLALADGPERRLELSFTPVGRAQVAAWVESEDGTIFRTLALTQAVAYRGVGNRPGATLMNSGFRWPYGRREGVLPVWAHRRAAAPGAVPFSRVIFQNRTSEGWASRSSSDFSSDAYYCLSFDQSRSRREALDAVSCASVFNSDKGRYLTAADLMAGYAEPSEDARHSLMMRPLPLISLYPPRRDIDVRSGFDHTDVSRFDSDARSAMPEIDAVTTATFVGDAPKTLRFTVPTEWPNGKYIVWVEVNVEGDYNASYNDSTHPTPRGASDVWDYWAQNYGYPYRGQPSVAFRVPVTISPAGGVFRATVPAGFASLDGSATDLLPLDTTISDDPASAPGSGADRLRQTPDGTRLTVAVPPTAVCEVPEPPPQCGVACGVAAPCDDGFICADNGKCVGLCDIDMSPQGVATMALDTHPDEKLSHRQAMLAFRVPSSGRQVVEYEVRYSTSPITDDASFERALPANAPSLDSVELVVPTDAPAGDLVQLEIGGLTYETHYYVAMRAVDECNAEGPITVAEVTTTPIHFTTVSPCFVATAAYGSPLAAEIGALRRFRDRYLLSNDVGRAAVDGYYSIGPSLASAVAAHDSVRNIARSLLTPLVALAQYLDREHDEGL